MTLPAGTRIGPYEVVAKLGEGGMGQVYRARDSKLNRDVAIKILPPAVAADGDRLMRFEREAQALAALNHPNIAQIFGVIEPAAGTHQTTALVMELVEGEDLACHLTGGPMPAADALAVARQIALALEAAHDAGIVHRDLKPANVKVRPDGTAKVLDFGLAKALGSDGTSAAADAMQSPTMTARDTAMGVILGTAAYMSPEQARGRFVDKRADIWAFGCVVYEMLTGQRAFRGGDVTEILASVMRDTPDWSALPADTPASIRRLLTRCLERDPKRRLRDIGDALHEIDAAAEREIAPPAITPQRSRWLGPLLWASGGAAAAAIAVIATSGGRSPAAAAPAIARMTIVAPPDAPLFSDSTAPDVVISADGRRLIYQGRRSDPEGARIAATQFVVRDLQAFEPTPLATLGFFPRAPFLSPDSAWIGFETTVGARVTPVLAKAPIAGGEMVVLCDLAGLGPLRGASWSGDGRITFATSQRATGLFQIASTGGGTPAPLTTPNLEAGEIDHVWPDVLPGNRGTLFTVVREKGFDVAVLPPDSKEWRVVIPGGSAARYLSTGHVVYVADGTLRGVAFDVASLRPTSDPAVLLTGVVTKSSGAANVAIAADGTLAYVAGTQPVQQRRVVWVSSGGTTALPLEPRDYRAVRLSPDKRRIAVALTERGSSSIWVYDIARDSFTRVSPRESSMQNPVWSPDGKYLAAWSITDKAIVKFAADGGGSADTLVRAETGTLYPGEWSPDGKTIAYVQERPSLGLNGVATTPPYAVRPLAVGSGAQVESAFSPNGRWIAHVSFDGTEPEIVIGPVATADRRWPVASRGRWPVWSADGRALLFVEGNAIHRVVIDPATGQPIGRATRWMDLPKAVTSRAFHIGPDGRVLMLESVEGSTAPAEIRVVLHWFEELRAKIPSASR